MSIPVFGEFYLSKQDFEKFTDEVDRLEEKHDLSNKNIKVSITNRLKTVAGNITVYGDMGDISKADIKINYKYYVKFGIGRIIKTLRHEVAHYLAYVKTGKLSHDKVFKDICLQLGGSMCNTMAGETHAASGSTQYIVSEYKWRYTCRCGNSFRMKKRLSEKVRKNPYKVCAKCRTSVKLMKEERI